MRKAVFLFVVLSMILIAGCSALSDIELTSEQIVLPTETATPAATGAPSPTLTPVPIRTPYPTVIHTPGTGINAGSTGGSKVFCRS